MAQRGLLFTMRLDEGERELFERLAERHGLSVAGLIRMLMKREEREAQRESGAATRDEPKTPKASKRTKRER